MSYNVKVCRSMSFDKSHDELQLHLGSCRAWVWLCNSSVAQKVVGGRKEPRKKYISPPVLVPECLNCTTRKCKYTYLNATVDCTVDQRLFREQMLSERGRQLDRIHPIMSYTWLFYQSWSYTFWFGSSFGGFFHARRYSIFSHTSRGRGVIWVPRAYELLLGEWVKILRYYYPKNVIILTKCHG